jgi:hypothetical protein
MNPGFEYDSGSFVESTNSTPNRENTLNNRSILAVVGFISRRAYV